MSGAPFPGSWSPSDKEPQAKGAVGEVTLRDGSKYPTYFCLKCEQKTALEGRPQTTKLIARYGKDATIHTCFTCHHTRAVDMPADCKESGDEHSPRA